MIAAVPGISITIHSPRGGDLVRRICLLVQILAVLGFDWCRINGVFGESEPSRCHEGYRGSYKPDCAQDLVLDVRLQTCRRVEGFHVPARLVSGHCGSANIVSVPPSAVK